MDNEKQMVKEKIVRVLKQYHDEVFTPGIYEHSIMGKAALMLENSVEVVRCKDCVEYNPRPDSDWFHGHCWLHDIDTYKDDYCSYGERKDK